MKQKDLEELWKQMEANSISYKAAKEKFNFDENEIKQSIEAIKKELKNDID